MIYRASKSELTESGARRVCNVNVVHISPVSNCRHCSKLSDH